MYQINIFDIMYEKYKITKPIRLIELFAGVGSQAMALRDLKANFEHYKVIEFDKKAIESYNAIHGTDFPHIDITTVNAETLNIVDTYKYDYILTYSFPCQDLSLAGERKGMSKDSGTRSGLLWEVERILDEINESEIYQLPQVLLMENVPEVKGKGNESDFEQWINKLESLGYTNFVEVLNAKDYGVPQNRNRCFMVSILGEYSYSFPKKKKLKIKLKNILEKEVEQKFYLSKEQINRISTSTYVSNRKRIQRKHYADTLCARDWKDPKCVDTEKGIRKLTPKEYWRIMGFTDKDFEKAQKHNSNTNLYKQAGNSIVKNVLMEIFKELL